MNTRSLIFSVLYLFVAFDLTPAHAQVPSLINYQGRLSDANGAPVTGSKNFVIRLYDAQTGGTLLYTEDLGSISLGTNGIYSFQFGSAGSSNALTSETVATTNGTATTFQKVLSSSPVVAGSVSVSDGTYTWSEAAGSSDEQAFGVSYASSLRRVTVNYYSAPPASGRNITATYRSVTTGISGALAGVGEHWMELSVDGTIQGTRQRVLAVPFALRSGVAQMADSAADPFVRQQVSDFMLSITGGRSESLNITLSKSSNYRNRVVQATGFEKFDAGASRNITFEVVPEIGSSRFADRFLINPGVAGNQAGNQARFLSGYYEIVFSDGEILQRDIASSYPQTTGQSVHLNPRPNSEIQKLRCSFSYEGGYVMGLGAAIFTSEKTNATFLVGGIRNVKRGAFCIYSADGSWLEIVRMQLNLQNGDSIECGQCEYIDIVSPVISITVECSSSSVGASISTIKLLY